MHFCVVFRFVHNYSFVAFVSTGYDEMILVSFKEDTGSFKIGKEIGRERGIVRLRGMEVVGDNIASAET